MTLAAVVPGCSDAADARDSETNSGGQTGSLLPPCPEDPGEPFVVPEGQTAFAERSLGDLSQVVVTNAQGSPVTAEVARKGSTTFVTTTDALTAGTYTVTYTCSSTNQRITREVTVVEAVPLPTEFGTLTFEEQALTGCSLVSAINLEWQPSAEFVPYLNLVELTILADGIELGILPTVQAFALDDRGRVSIQVPLCRGTSFCGPATAIYSVTARIAGEDGVWTSPEVEVNQTCLTERKTMETSCAVAVPSPNSASTGRWLLAGIAVGLGAITRRRS